MLINTFSIVVYYRSVLEMTPLSDMAEQMAVFFLKNEQLGNINFLRLGRY